MKILKAGITLYWSPSGCILTDQIVPASTLLTIRTCESGAIIWSCVDRCRHLDDHHQRVVLGETLKEKEDKAGEEELTEATWRIKEKKRALFDEQMRGRDQKRRAAGTSSRGEDEPKS
jgi:hypothetical protein